MWRPLLFERAWRKGNSAKDLGEGTYQGVLGAGFPERGSQTSVYNGVPGGICLKGGFSASPQHSDAQTRTFLASTRFPGQRARDRSEENQNRRMGRWDWGRKSWWRCRASPGGVRGPQEHFRDLRIMTQQLPILKKGRTERGVRKTRLFFKWLAQLMCTNIYFKLILS